MKTKIAVLRSAPFLVVLFMCAAVTAQQIPANTRVAVRVNEALSSANAKVGDTFTGVLTEPITVNGQTLFPVNSNVQGHVTNAEDSGRLSHPGILELQLDSVDSGSRGANLNTAPWTLKGASHIKSNVAKIGGGTAIGAIIGGLAGGGKGAAIGAGVGAAGGTGVAAATGKKEATVDSESIIAWMTTQPSNVNNHGSQGRGRGNRNRYNDYRGNNAGANRENNYDQSGNNGGGDYRRGDYRQFSDNDRNYISQCYSGGDRSGLPPGLAKKDRLPPGLEKQLQKNGKLPPGLQKRVQPLSADCQDRLPRLPADWERVVYGDRVILLDPQQTIVDIFRIATGG
jgi:hypothetical protein